jgi:hypothetical protein
LPVARLANISLRRKWFDHQYMPEAYVLTGRKREGVRVIAGRVTVLRIPAVAARGSVLVDA